MASSKKDMRRADLGRIAPFCLFFCLMWRKQRADFGGLVAVIPYVDPPKEKSETDMGGTGYC